MKLIASLASLAGRDSARATAPAAASTRAAAPDEHGRADDFAALLAGFLGGAAAPSTPPPPMAPGLFGAGDAPTEDAAGADAPPGDADGADGVADTAATAAGGVSGAAAANAAPASAADDAAAEADAATPTPAVRRAGATPAVAPVGAGMNAEFTARLDRTIRRMRDEFGHEVRVVEGWRSQERQDALHAQGRTAPGPVVTWTRHSQHTKGRAADVIIDGTYDNAVGYRRLARVAAEEGLRTLGPKDPGHVELAGGARPGGATTAYAEARTQAATPARVAAVAATPASVAAVARVAPVAHPGSAGRTTADAEPADFEPYRPPPFGRGDALFANGASGPGASAPVSGAAGPTPAERTAQILDTLAARDAAPSQSMLFRLGEDGGAVRLGMRGNAVNATIVTPGAGLAETLGRDLHQLRDALAAHGIGTDRLSVRSAHSATATTLRADLGDGVPLAQPRAAESGSGSTASRGHHDSDTHRRQPDPEDRPSSDRDPRSRREQQRKGS